MTNTTSWNSGPLAFSPLCILWYFPSSSPFCFIFSPVWWFQVPTFHVTLRDNSSVLVLDGLYPLSSQLIPALPFLNQNSCPAYSLWKLDVALVFISCKDKGSRTLPWPFSALPSYLQALTPYINFHLSLVGWFVGLRIYLFIQQILLEVLLGSRYSSRKLRVL